MNIYIDESGNLGRQGRYFIITCLIPYNAKRLKNLNRSACKKYGFKRQTPPLEELKGYHMSFEEKQDFINRLMIKDDFRFAYIVADKKHLSKELLARKNICFNYLTAHLLNTFIRKADEDVNIICDNRNIKVTSGRSLEEYLQVEAYTKWKFKHRLNLNYADSAQCSHLQTTDIISNTISGRYMLNFGHFYRLLSKHRQYRILFPYKTFGSHCQSKIKLTTKQKSSILQLT